MANSKQKMAYRAYLKTARKTGDDPAERGELAGKGRNTANHKTYSRKTATSLRGKTAQAIRLAKKYRGE